MLYVMSDPHAQYGLFEELLHKIGFGPEDELIICGDIIDKGPDSIRLAQRVFRTPNIHCIMGNHEYAFLKYYWSVMQSVPNDSVEAMQQLREYFPNDGHLLDWEIVDGFANMPCYIEREDFICVHAGLPLDADGRVLPLEEASIEQLVHDRYFKEPTVLPTDSKCVFFGHTPASFVSGKEEILLYPRPGQNSVKNCYKVHLDMGTMTSGVVGCICVDTGECFYVKKELTTEQKTMPEKGSIFVTGDTHGCVDVIKLVEFAARNEWLTKDDYVIIAGDFGAIWDKGSLERSLNVYSAFPWTTLFVDGNHENFDLINAYPIEKWKGGKVHKIRDDVIHLMRGQVYEIYGKRIFTFGGGTSIDRCLRTPKISWWPQELPTYDDLDEAEKNLKACNKKVDYIITHSCSERTLYELPLYAQSIKAKVFLDNVFLSNFESVQYKRWYFGHYHLDRDLDEKRSAVYQRILLLD